MPIDKASVSVIIPCRNESKYIKKVLSHLLQQDFSDVFEIIVVDAMSTDDTVTQVEDFIRERHIVDGRIRIVRNEKIIIPAGMNLGIKEAHGNIIIRMDGHAVPKRNYIRLAVETLSDNFDVVGGVCKSMPATDGLLARAISIGISSMFGVGDSRFRIASPNQQPQLVDTVPFGCFRKSLWQELGGFDETLLTNEDYDFNYRVRKNGGKVYLNPALLTEYIARGSLRELSRQFVRYGIWKVRMLAKQPRSIRLRHTIPPLFLLGVVVSGISSFFSRFFFILFISVLVAYVGATFIASFSAALRARNVLLTPFLMLVFVVMHFSWGGGFLYSVAEQLLQKK